MFISHSLKNILRSWRKTTLFTILMLSLVMILPIGLSLSVTIRDFLAQCDENYTTIGVFDYIGPDYPDETKYDPSFSEAAEAMNDLFAVENECVDFWDSNETALGHIQGSTYLNQSALYKNNAVIVVYLRSEKETEGVYSGIVAEALYSFNDSQGKMIYVNTMGAELELDRYYLLHGAFYKGQSSYTYFMVTPCSDTWAAKTRMPNEPEDRSMSPLQMEAIPSAMRLISGISQTPMRSSTTALPYMHRRMLKICCPFNREHCI